MAADASKNGSAKKTRSPRSSKTLSSMKPPPTVHSPVLKPSSRTASRSGGFLSRLVGLSMRLFAWYAILTVLFRCPPSLDHCTETTPTVCVGYFQLKHIVVPHVEPYYNTYAAPYVQTVRPYYEAADRTVLTPAWGYAQKYGTPAVEKAQVVGKAQWEKNVQPHLVHYRKLAQAKYDDTLAQHVNQARDTLGPYYEIARTNALQTYHDVFLPTYQYAQPYALQGYAAASAFTTRHAVPTAKWAWNKTYAFLDGTVWPQLRILYTEAVEPQLVKIGRRLGRYNGTGATQKASETISKTIANKATSSFTKPTISSSSTYSAPPILSSASSFVSSAASVVSDSISSALKPAATPYSKFSETAEQVEAPEPDDDEEEKRRIARETVAEDLKAWQMKYTKAADEGAAEIQERVGEIAHQMVSREIRIRGAGLLKSLQDTIVSELVAIRGKIHDVVGSVQKAQATPEQGEEQIVRIIRAAGLEIKKKAKDVRSWHEAFDIDVRTQVTAAADSHFEILGSIKDLALQKIGMKWAWTDGITYKDWAKYHLLRSRFLEWEQDMEKLVVSHPGLIECQNEGQAIEDRAMELATSAAKELARLKQVAMWKLAALDDTDDFDSETTQATYDAKQRAKANGAASKERNEASSAQQAAVDSDVAENPEKVLENEAASSTSTTPAGETDVEGAVAADVSMDSSKAADAVSSLSSAFSTASENIASAVEETNTASLPSSAGFSASREEKTAVAEPEPEPLVSVEAMPALPEVVANISETTKPEAGNAEEPVPVKLPESETAMDGKLEEPQNDKSVPVKKDEEATGNIFVEAADQKADEEASSPPPSQKIESVKPAMFGAAAQAVPSRKPILDDDTVESLKKHGGDIPATLSSVAASAYSVALSRASVQYESAVKIISDSMPKGTAQPMHVSLLSSVSDAYGKAVASASAHLDEAIKSAESLYGAASKKVAPTPTPTPYLDWAAVESIAAERLSQGRSWAEEQYSSAKVAIGAATPTPTSPVEKLMQNAQYNYYAGLGVAQARYTEFLSAASAAFSSMTATPTPTDIQGTMSSVASVAGESAASVASVVGENASSVASVVGENASSVYDAAGSAIGAAGSAVSENWEAVVSDLSSRVYGVPAPTPWYEGLYNAAGEYVAAATDAVNLGTQTEKNAAAKATDEAAKQYAVVSSIISELIVGREPSFSESIFSRLGDAYNLASATAASVAGEATDAVKSAAEAGRQKVEQVKDEL
ncbi:hypothetical protein MGG_09082 [Pyricularia oryzae 70-15]|uniref:Transcription factor hoxa13 n=3 Tax=Pyricularia oryzae TaxID=318829 RepID=G4MZT3_PYRO7|nr:uncharacterized protein MGG_09082 [Pyricularia oryzae 70-15]EHA51377.1 hypothetical protein MGG_09082 [Pyricularia oryzae 70-15]ELQ34996.1 hypothetical protein OOU_Y34scaffold00734g7 [Pyricularia oryzae Y34]KAI7912750.1 hypothetical protein M9X92_009833 [Pyricularia oryzae]KAI7913544.1 hypothetical protein M0657_009991 [Pyricularia oryzae]